MIGPIVLQLKDGVRHLRIVLIDPLLDLAPRLALDGDLVGQRPKRRAIDLLGIERLNMFGLQRHGGHMALSGRPPHYRLYHGLLTAHVLESVGRLVGLCGSRFGLIGGLSLLSLLSLSLLSLSLLSLLSLNLPHMALEFVQNLHPLLRCHGSHLFEEGLREIAHRFGTDRRLLGGSRRMRWERACGLRAGNWAIDGDKGGLLRRRCIRGELAGVGTSLRRHCLPSLQFQMALLGGGKGYGGLWWRWWWRRRGCGCWCWLTRDGNHFGASFCEEFRKFLVFFVLGASQQIDRSRHRLVGSVLHRHGGWGRHRNIRPGFLV